MEFKIILKCSIDNTYFLSNSATITFTFQNHTRASSRIHCYRRWLPLLLYRNKNCVPKKQPRCPWRRILLPHFSIFLAISTFLCHQTRDGKLLHYIFIYSNSILIPYFFPSLNNNQGLGLNSQFAKIVKFVLGSWSTWFTDHTVFDCF